MRAPWSECVIVVRVQSHGGTWVPFVCWAGGGAPLAVEREEDEAEHVDGRQEQRRQRARSPTAACAHSAKVRNRISSLLKKPASPGTPAIASDPIRNVQ